MKQIRIFLLIITALLFSTGCSQKWECEPKIEYLEAKHPRMKVLYEVESYKITDYMIIDNTYVAVNQKQLKKASTTSNKVRRQNRFYVKQNITYNDKFVKKGK